MFARVITTQAGTDGLSSVLRLAEEQLPAAREQPGFQGFYLLTDAEGGKVMTIPLWDTQGRLRAVEARAAAIREQAVADTGLTSPHSISTRVAMHA